MGSRHGADRDLIQRHRVTPHLSQLAVAAGAGRVRLAGAGVRALVRQRVLVRLRLQLGQLLARCQRQGSEAGAGLLERATDVCPSPSLPHR